MVFTTTHMAVLTHGFFVCTRALTFTMKDVTNQNTSMKGT